MADDQLLEIQKQHQAEQHKYTYFMLAAAASAIAFAVQKTSGMKISWSTLPIGLAVASWALSFFCGAQNRLWVQATLLANFSLLKLLHGTHEYQPPNGWQKEAAIQGVKQALSSNAQAAGKYGIWQFRFLVIGGVCFLVWHVWQMILTT